MIKKLKIVNFILAEDVTLDFENGFNALTGETGAGKSVVIGALEHILGKQTRGDLAFDNNESVYLEATFDVEKIIASLEQDFNEFLIEDNEIVISKEITTKGRAVSRVNGKVINRKKLLELKEILIDFHNQRDQLKLFDNLYQLEVLDAWGRLTPLREKVATAYYSLKKSVEKKKRLEKEERESSEKYLLYEYQIEELESLNLASDEENQLSSEIDLLTHSEEILSLCKEMQQVFIEQENSLVDIVTGFQNRLQRVGKGNEPIRNILRNLSGVAEYLNNIQKESRALEDGIDLDEERLKMAEERLSVILRIKTKYKRELPELLNYLDEMKQAVAKKSSRVNEIENLKQIIGQQTYELIALSDELSVKRKEVAISFSDSISNDLADLSIPDGLFYVDITTVGKECTDNGMIGGINETGSDKVEFLFSANKGIDPQKLNKVASGGELSRLLMIVKKILATRFDSPTLVLDEIDIGIGGKTANNMGKYISEVALFHQVICITHLPQIASYAKRQFLISKHSETRDEVNKPVISVKELTQQERREEIARMLSGTKSDIALKHADEILKETPETVEN